MNYGFFFNIYKDVFDLLKRLWKFNASINTNRDQHKMEYTILRQNHVIEKGLSMKSPRKGFGQNNAKDLCIRLIDYSNLYGQKNPSFLEYPIATLNAYIEYQKKSNTEIKEIEDLYTKLAQIHENKSCIGGIENLSANNINDISFDFEKFINQRHSIRFFSKEKPNPEKINKALRIAQRTPSACNRQCWKVHQYDDENCTKLLLWQEGARGFENEPKIALLVTADLKAFLYHEPFQAYIDGGMYAMSLIYSLHSMGLGTIPLSCGFGKDKLNKLRKQFNIPENEVPIAIIATGILPPNAKVAISSRKSIENVVIKHENIID